MLKFFSRSGKPSNVPDQIYGTVVARAHDPLFFTEFELPDTVMGRFEVLAMHVYMFSRRMKREGGSVAISLSQEVFDLFVADVERALRELGIGDTSVPKRKKSMVRSFYGQIEDFDSPLDDKDTELLVERINQRFHEGQNQSGSQLLADYVCKLDLELSAIDMKIIKAGKLDWRPMSSQESE